MFRSILLLTMIFSVISGCGTDNANRVNAKLGDGSEAIVYVEEESVDGVRLLVVDYKAEKARLKESEVVTDVEKIWESVRPEAEKRGLDEALIKYRQPDQDSDEAGEYIGLLFEAERIENGTWKLRKVN